MMQLRATEDLVVGPLINFGPNKRRPRADVNCAPRLGSMVRDIQFSDLKIIGFDSVEEGVAALKRSRGRPLSATFHWCPGISTPLKADCRVVPERNCGRFVINVIDTDNL